MTINFITTTPSGPLAPIWTPSTTGPSRARRLFMTPATVTRLQSNWTNPYTATMKNSNGGILGQLGTNADLAVANALIYLATGDVSKATLAASQALATPFVSENIGYACKADPCAFVLDWCYPDLSAGNRTALINLCESNIVQHLAVMAANVNGMWGLHESFHLGWFGFLFSQMAIQGEPGATDRRTLMRNAIQNSVAALNEAHDGIHPVYPYQEPFWCIPYVAYETATGQNVGLNWFTTRAEGICRLSGYSKLGIQPWVGDQDTAVNGITQGNNLCGECGPPFLGYMMATHLGGNGLWQWIGDDTVSVQPTWAIQNDHPMWLGMAYWDSTITATPPSAAGLRKNRIYPAQRGVNFRSGWTTPDINNKDVRAWLVSAIAEGHSSCSCTGSLEVHRGVDDLLPRGAMYAAESNNPAFQYTGAAEGQKGWTISSYSRNTMTFATATNTPDTDGQQYLTPARPDLVASSGMYCPNASNFSGNAPTYRRGEIILADFPAGDAYGMAFVDATECYNNSAVQMYQRKVCTIPGAVAGSMTIIVRDQFVLNGSATNNIKWGFFQRNKPTVVSTYDPELVAGGATAGIIYYNGAAGGLSDAPKISGINPAATLTDTNWTILSGGSSYSNNLYLRGSGVVGATISIYDGVTLLGTAIADASGDWGYETGAVLTNAAHSFTATQTVGIVTSQPTLPYTVTVLAGITSFNAASGSTFTIAGKSFTNDNANKAWSITNPDTHTLVFEIRSGDISTGGLFRTEVGLTVPVAVLNQSVAFNYEFLVVGGATNDQFGANKWFTIGQIHDTLSTSGGPGGGPLRAPYEQTLGGVTVVASNGDKFSVDRGFSGNITSASFTNEGLATVPLTRDVWHKMNVIVRMSENVTNNNTRGLILCYLDGVLFATFGDFEGPLGYFNSTPPNKFYLRLGIYRSGGTQTQIVKYRNIVYP